MIEPGKKIEDIAEFAPLRGVVDSPLKADIVAFYYDNPTEDDDASEVARRLGEERINLVAQCLAELEEGGILVSKIEGVMRANYYHLAPASRMKEALDLIFKKAGRRDYWKEFTDYVRAETEKKHRTRRTITILASILAVGCLAVAGYFVYGHMQERSRVRAREELSMKIGIRETTYPNGKLKSRIEYFKGDRNGPFAVWFENGRKMAEGAYRNGLPQGTWTFWDIDGTQIEVVTYKEGRAVAE